jgi:formate dehydrogenase major subunit
MGHEKDFAFKDAEAIFNDIAKAVPAYAGINYAKLEKPEAIQWPAAGGVFGTAFLYADKFSTKDGKAAFAAVEYKAGEAADAAFPFMVAAQWPMGTLSMNSASIVREWPFPTVFINKDDAKAQGINNGDAVKVSGKSGSIVVAAKVTADIKKGVVSLPFAAAAVKIEKVTEEA